MITGLPNLSTLNTRDRLLQKLIRLYCLMVAPALFWIGVAGLMGKMRLQGDDATTYGFMLQAVAALMFASAWFVWMIRAGKGRRLWWVIALLAAALGMHVLIASQPALLGSSHVFVDVAIVMILLVVLLSCFMHQQPDATLAALTHLQSLRAVALVGTCISVFGAYWMVERDLQQVHRYAQARAVFVAHLLQAGLEEPVVAVQRMVERWSRLETQPGPSYIDQELLSHVFGIKAIKRLTVQDESGRIAVDHEDGDRAIGDLERVQASAGFQAFLDQVTQRGQTMMSPPGLVADKPELVFVAAQIDEEGYPRRGWLVATIDLRALVKDAFIDEKPLCCFAMSIDQIEIYRSDAPVDVPAMAQATESFDFEKNFMVKVSYWRERLPGEVGLSYYPLLILLVGLIFTFFAMMSFHLAQIATLRARLLFEQSRCDPLTGLPNRRVLQEELERAWQATEQQQDQMGLMLIDLSGMRLINDSLGHAIADQLLLVVTTKIRDVLPAQALLARLDGGEFVVTVKHVDEASLTALAEKIIEALAGPMTVQGRELTVAVVIGMSQASGRISDPMQLLREADQAMVSARADTQLSWASYKPAMGEALSLRLLLSQELNAAMETGALSMVYQPLISTQTGRVVAMEALIRWKHHERGQISPAQFIPLAEETGQIVSLTSWTLEQVCADIKQRFSEEAQSSVPVAVNISPAFFQRDDFLEKIRAVLARTGVLAQQLQIEITEGLLLTRQSEAIKKLHALHAIGVMTSLDDFGTGYSSLSYLTNLPIHKIKLDRSFVLNVIENRRDGDIVHGVIAIAHQLNLLVVVEGVETAEQAQCLAQLRADQLQGYVFSKPIPAIDMQRLLLDQSGFKALLNIV